MVFSALAQQHWDEVMALGADLICFDLEDGTARDRKDEARALCACRRALGQQSQRKGRGEGRRACAPSGRLQGRLSSNKS
jgi:citrate lyase beta subunit